MNTSGHNSSHSRDDSEIARLLREIEAERAAGAESGEAPIEAMRRDRAALRSALRTDLALPLPPHRTAQFSQVVRDEIDRALLTDLSRGVPVHDHLPVSSVKPIRRASREPWALRSSAWHPARIMATAATFALVAGLAWLAMQRPSSSDAGVASGTGGSARELPSWATLPPRMPEAGVQAVATGPDPIANPANAVAAEATVTRDAQTALAWARRGVLAVRIVTDSPRRDRERLDSFAQVSGRGAQWAISTSVPAGFTVVPTHPWPIETALADGGEPLSAARSRPDTATLAAFGLTLRPTVEAVDAARAELEESLAGTVTFERVEGLAPFAEGPQPEPAPDSASDVIWWKKPAGQWSPRLRVPVLVEFGTLARDRDRPLEAVPAVRPAE